MPFSACRFTHSSSIFLVFSRTIAVKHGAHEFLQRLQMMLRWACYITWIAAGSLTGALAEALVAAQFSSLLNAGSNCINSFLWSEHILFFLMAECRDTFGAHANANPFYLSFAAPGDEEAILKGGSLGTFWCVSPSNEEGEVAVFATSIWEALWGRRHHVLILERGGGQWGCWNSKRQSWLWWYFLECYTPCRWTEKKVCSRQRGHHGSALQILLCVAKAA